MKLVVSESQFKRVVQKIAESKKGRSLAMARKAGIASIFPKTAIMNNPQRFRYYERERAGIEEADLLNGWYEEDNSDPQL